MAFDLEGFTGIVRVFPLPNLVMFPHVMQPLHIFEPRYLSLLEASLKSDKLIAMGILAPGWQSNYDGRPEVNSIACIGRVAAHNRVEENRYNALLMGLRRVKLLEELPATKPYREFHASICEEEFPADPLTTTRLHDTLLDQFHQMLPQLPLDSEQFEQVSGHAKCLSMLCDIISYSLKIDVTAKQSLLGELNVERRAELLIENMQKLLAEKQTACAFPPAFSLN